MFPASLEEAKSELAASLSVPSWLCLELMPVKTWRLPGEALGERLAGRGGLHRILRWGKGRRPFCSAKQ